MAARRITDRVLDLDTLEVLGRVAADRSLSRAAESLGITQQAVSARIAAAERALAIPLVVRASTGSRLTEAGAVVLELAAPVLDAARRLEAGIDALRLPVGTITVAASQTIAEFLLPDWLIRLRQEAPDVQVRLVAGNSTEVLDLVRTGGAELGFVEGPSVPPDVVAEPVATDELVVVVAPGHPWADAAAIAVEDLAAVPLLVREEGSGTRATLERRLAEAGHALPPPAAVLDTTAIVRANARAGVAPAVMSRRAVAADLASGDLVRVPLSGAPLERRFTAIRLGAPSVAARAVLAVVRAR